MSANVFLDTNIILYTYSADELEKRKIAQTLIVDQKTIISTQVIQELINVLRKKFGYEYSSILPVVEEVCTNSMLYTNTFSTIKRGMAIAAQYKYSFYDSLIIAAAIEANCSILYSEDLHNTQRIDTLEIRNPFMHI